MQNGGIPDIRVVDNYTETEPQEVPTSPVTLHNDKFHVHVTLQSAAATCYSDIMPSTLCADTMLLCCRST